MKAQRNLAASGSSRRKLVYAALAILFCLVLPTTTVDAGGFGYEATGVVTCKVSYWDGTSANVQYPVELLTDGTVVGRWGPGKDVGYGSDVAGDPSGDRKFTQYLYSISNPDDPATFEKLYSETGKLDVKVNRNGGMNIAGKSFVVMDYYFVPYPPDSGDSVSLDAECTWNLSGNLPGG